MCEVEKKIEERTNEIIDEFGKEVSIAQAEHPKSELGYKDYLIAFLVRRIATIEISLEERC
jgi:hypothetical protein